MKFTTVSGFEYDVDLKNRQFTTLQKTVNFAYAVGIYAGSQAALFLDSDKNVLFETGEIKSVDPEDDLLAIDSAAVEPGHVIFRTYNSVYELDQEQKLFRRLAGLNQLTSGHLTADLEWHPYETAYVGVGRSAVVTYPGETRARRTSVVRDIFGQIVEPAPAS